MAKEQEKLEQHPLAKLFPSPDSGTLDALKKRISHVGKLKTPVVLFEEKVIERWPEYGACVEFSLPFATTEYSGTEDELVEHLLQTNTRRISKFRKTCQEEAANESLGKETQYLVYMRWDYEPGKLELHAAWDEVQHCDKATGICILKSGRKIRYEAEAIALVYTAEIAKTTAEAINRKGFCSGQRVLRPDSRVPRIFDRVGMRFMEKAQSLNK